jgi:hypothetical protein
MIKINLYNNVLIFRYHSNLIHKHEFSPVTKIQTLGRCDLIRTACTQYYSFFFFWMNTHNIILVLQHFVRCVWSIYFRHMNLINS